MFYGLLIIVFSIILAMTIKKSLKTKKPQIIKSIPNSWKEYLNNKIKFYQKLNNADKIEFENRILHFVNTTRIIGFGNHSIDEIDKLLGKIAEAQDKLKVINTWGKLQ